MKLSPNLMLIAALCFFLSISCGKKESPAPTQQPTAVTPTPSQSNPQQSSGYDLETKGIPLFVTANYIDLFAISRIARFRSGEGHDYSDAFEQCRSMKHYFQPKSGIDWATIKIYSPVSGTIIKVDQEWAGKQVHIQPENYPDFKIILFHVDLQSSFVLNSKVIAGQQIGTHIGNQTYSDIAVGVVTTKGYKLLSYFDVMTANVFKAFQDRGVATKEQLLISKTERDSDPLNCNGEAFGKKGTLPDWVILN